MVSTATGAIRHRKFKSELILRTLDGHRRAHAAPDFSLALCYRDNTASSRRAVEP